MGPACRSANDRADNNDRRHLLLQSRALMIVAGASPRLLPPPVAATSGCKSLSHSAGQTGAPLCCQVEIGAAWAGRAAADAADWLESPPGSAS